MPVEISARTGRWLGSLKLISGQRVAGNGKVELSYNDQIYLENGYLVAQLLRRILRESGSSSEGLMRVRKIAYLSSNQNWRIIGDILGELGFETEIDPQQISESLLETILEFLCDRFVDRGARERRQKVTYVDLSCFQSGRSVQTARNLLQFLILALHQSFGVEMNECLGLMVDKGKYLCQVIVIGTNDKGFDPVIKMYQTIIRNVAVLNQLMAEEYGGEEKLLSILGTGVLSENEQVCQLCCLLLDSTDSEWPQGKGMNVLIRSPHSQALDLLMRRLGPKLCDLFNPSLSQRFGGKFLLQIKVYSRLLRYFYTSLFGKQILKCLQVGYYISKAFVLFEPDMIDQSSDRQRTAVRYLLAVACRFFYRKMSAVDVNKVLYCFETGFTKKEEQKLTALCILFELLQELIQKQRAFGLKLFSVIWKYYSQGSPDVKTFVLDNLLYLLRIKPNSFPIVQFLEEHEPKSTLQSTEYQIFLTISEIKELPDTIVDSLLKTATIYYYQQLSAGAILNVISNLSKSYQPIVWAQQISQQILAKWPGLDIPPYQALPLHSKKIKYRSVGLKKREMMQFTELNRYKSMLLVLVQIQSKSFLMGYAKNINVTIGKVERSKVKEMQNTKDWLNNLLALIDAKRMEIRERTIVTPTEEGEHETLINELEEVEDENYQQEQSVSERSKAKEFGRISQVENEFMKQDELPPLKMQVSPLLPFSDQQIDYHPLVSQQLFFENYQLIYLRSLTQRHSSLLYFLTSKYNSSLNLEHFFKSIGIMPYVESGLYYLQQLNNKLILAEDRHEKIVAALIVQAALLAFEFKKFRRVTIKCVDSFYQLLEEKNCCEKSEKEEQSVLTTKVEFQWKVTLLIKRANPKGQVYFDCFEIVSELLEKALGIGEIEPISRIVSQMENLTPSKPPKLEHSIVVKEGDLTELSQLQRIIQNESQAALSRANTRNYRSTPLKKNLDKSQVLPLAESKQIPERWAQVQKRIIMRRRELQARNMKG